MSISGLFALRYPPPIPCAFSGRETFGSPKFPSYPRGCMPWSLIPVVSLLLAIAQQGLLPSVRYKTSAFSDLRMSRLPDYPQDHDYTYFGAQYRACILAFPGFRLPLRVLPAGSATDLMANLWSGGTFLTSMPRQAHRLQHLHAGRRHPVDAAGSSGIHYADPGGKNSRRLVGDEPYRTQFRHGTGCIVDRNSLKRRDKPGILIERMNPDFNLETPLLMIYIGNVYILRRV
jgi:hypothetical protein